MGETAIDEDTFNDYLSAMREHYTADKVRVYPADSTGPDPRVSQYHLLGE